VLLGFGRLEAGSLPRGSGRLDWRATRGPEAEPIVGAVGILGWETGGRWCHGYAQGTGDVLRPPGPPTSKCGGLGGRRSDATRSLGRFGEVQGARGISPTTKVGHFGRFADMEGEMTPAARDSNLSPDPEGLLVSSRVRELAEAEARERRTRQIAAVARLLRRAVRLENGVDDADER
jgi:hypothetical protein